MTGWYPMDRFVPGDGDSEEARRAPQATLTRPFPDEPHDDESCTGDEDCDCPCATCRGATAALHRL